jgi:hypothetical protein
LAISMSILHIFLVDVTVVFHENKFWTKHAQILYIETTSFCPNRLDTSTLSSNCQAVLGSWVYCPTWGDSPLFWETSWIPVRSQWKILHRTNQGRKQRSRWKWPGNRDFCYGPGSGHISTCQFYVEGFPCWYTTLTILIAFSCRFPYPFSFTQNFHYFPLQKTIICRVIAPFFGRYNISQRWNFTSVSIRRVAE